MIFVSIRVLECALRLFHAIVFLPSADEGPPPLLVDRGQLKSVASKTAPRDPSTFGGGESILTLGPCLASAS